MSESEEKFEKSKAFVLAAIREVGIRARHFAPRGCDEGNWAVQGSVEPHELKCVEKLGEKK